jgi:hypothetical protein
MLNRVLHLRELERDDAKQMTEIGHVLAVHVTVARCKESPLAGWDKLILVVKRPDAVVSSPAAYVHQRKQHVSLPPFTGGAGYPPLLRKEMMARGITEKKVQFLNKLLPVLNPAISKLTRINASMVMVKCVVANCNTVSRRRIGIWDGS